MEQPDLAKAILFSQKSSTPPLFKALSVEYEDRLILGEVRDTQKDICEKYGVTKFPSVLIFPKGSTEPVVYDGMQT